MSVADQLYIALATTAMTVDQVRERAELCLEDFPNLTVAGWHLDGAPYDRDFDMRQVWVAALFLILFGERRKTINSKDVDAYSFVLKRAVENWTKASGAFVYVADGAFILAALILGFKCRQRPFNPDGELNIVVTPTIRHYCRSEQPFSPLFPPAH